MKQINHIPPLQKAVSDAREKGKTIGLVPTMGALHKGHISLINTAEKNGDFIVVSIFVNPTQFNNPDDLARYPRDLVSDLRMLVGHGVEIVFVPAVEEMYPEADTRQFDLSPLDQVMEGKFRPGHFNGVAQIVSRLFEAVQPDRAYFGQKDFQQLAVIRKLVDQLNLDIEIIGCPIIREADGLAMSSRNQLLTPEQRAAAPHIHAVLQKARALKNSRSPRELQAMVKEAINNHPLMQLEYFEIVDDQELKPIVSWDNSANKVGCIAVHLSEIRLIDNIYFH
ncbi:MAG: pantoate--beta-alanine ligase [Bacteroidales bacterium]|nr:pantoate--beta-alanine ligase [Bacteroidales bacterium]MDT8430660.1 pantoate--beta-alanine ligase [Bacteroidales bacterium]